MKTRNEKIEEIIAKMEKLYVRWWESEENHNTAKREHNRLEHEIRADMADIGIDFDTVAAEFGEDMRELADLLKACLRA